MRCPHCDGAEVLTKVVEGGEVVMCLDCGATTLVQ